VQPRYPIRAVAKLTGLSLDTLRAWERRYQAVIPDRTERGRQYGQPHIDRLILLSRLVQQGHAIGQIAALPDPELHSLLASPSTATPPPAAEIPLAPPLLAPILTAIEHFDSTRAGEELSRIAAILSPRDLVYEVALPLMRETGSRWHNGSFAISQEHMVSQILRNLLGGMMHLFRHSPSAARVVFSTFAGETHEFGILAASVLAALSGLEPVYLGPNLPAAEIVLAAERAAAAVVVIGVTYRALSAAQEIRAIAGSLPAHIELWVGGEIDDSLDVSGIPREITLLKDLQDFEKQCLRWRN
jgi:DNA-binding transcriptional MerR regulator/methylmalonyl-CoA mutase cobalamin-binding subunit